MSLPPHSWDADSATTIQYRPTCLGWHPWQHFSADLPQPQGPSLQRAMGGPIWQWCLLVPGVMVVMAVGMVE